MGDGSEKRSTNSDAPMRRSVAVPGLNFGRRPKCAFVIAMTGMTGFSAAPQAAMVSFTAATSWLNENGFGRKANCWFSGRLLANASSA